MNALDLIVIGLAVLAALGGYQLGFAARVASWVGLAAGLLVETIAVPRVADLVSESLDERQLVIVSTGVLATIAIAGLVCGLVIGDRLRLHVPPRRRHADKVAGASAGILAVIVLAWVLTPALADASGWPARETRSSVLARWIDRTFPEAPDASQALRRILGDTYPEVLRSFDPAPPVGPPPPSSGLDQATAERVARSTVKVTAEGCGRLALGSGFVVADGLVATNAHVVAGGTATRVELVDGTHRDTQVVAFDPRRDVAILATETSIGPALPLASPEEGDIGAVFGHPLGAPLRLAPFEVADKITATGTDIYDGDLARRKVIVLAAALAKGDSGSALVDPAGEVIGMTFALAPDRPGVAYALQPPEIEAVLADVTPTSVGTGPCLA